MIRLKQLQIENFLSIGKADVALSSQGLVLVQGFNNDSGVASSNGAGKSAVFEALLWGLFGRTYRGLTGDDVINRKVGRDCAVGLSFSLSGQECELLRFRRVRKEGSGLLLYVEGEDKSRPTMPETQKELEKLLGFGYESFTNAVYFGQSLAHFSSLTDAQQKRVLEELLGLSVLPKSLAIVRERLRGLGKKKSTLKTKQSMLEKQKEEIEGRIKDLEKAEKKRKEKQAKGIGKIEAEIATTEKELKKAQEALKKASHEFQKQAREVSGKESKVQSQIRKVELNIQKSQAVFESIQKRATKIVETEVTYCPYIEADCPLEKERQEKEAEELDKQLIEHKSKVASEGGRMKILRKEEAKIERQKKLLKKKEQAADTAFRDTELLEGHLNDLKTKLEEAEKEAQEETDLSKLLSQENKRLRGKSVALEKTGTSFRRVRSREKMLEFWETGFGNAGVKSYMLDSVAEILNKKAHDFTTFLTDGEVGITFQTQSKLKSGEVREKFGIDIQGQGGNTTYTASSGGERRRIDVCILLALSELTGIHGKLPNLLVFDEVFDHLDTEGMNRLIALLRSKLLEQRESVFVLTHSEALANYFERKLVVTKDNGFSTVQLKKG